MAVPGWIGVMAFAAALQAAAQPRIEAFTSIPSERIAPGTELRFLVVGSPRAEVVIGVPGIGALETTETGEGFYHASYRLRPGDDAARLDEAFAQLLTAEGAVTRCLTVKVSAARQPAPPAGDPQEARAR